MKKKDNIEELFDYYWDDPEFDNAVLSELGIGAASFGGGMAVGALLAAVYNKFNDKKFTCNDVSDPKLKKECIIKVIDSLIDNLRITSKECDRTVDPAQCKLEIVEKIEKLTQKKYKITKSINIDERISLDNPKKKYKEEHPYEDE